ncbi:hypothetical protein BRADI_2g48440v3 [Brachypodium distachyon]|uniref:Uncharacterized protein n=1 Tax=Brachypodium distachyon TaxID=15368 RepID=A0A0Q3MZ45_BRADI|nr:hypothetical protein BRADI_2g48440v3 [Brachypodium distachyon]
MAGSAISGGAARAAAIVWTQRHQRLLPQAEVLPRSLAVSALQFALKTAVAIAAPNLLPELVCAAGPYVPTYLHDDL